MIIIIANNDTALNLCQTMFQNILHRLTPLTLLSSLQHTAVISQATKAQYNQMTCLGNNALNLSSESWAVNTDSMVSVSMLVIPQPVQEVFLILFLFKLRV